MQSESSCRIDPTINPGTPLSNSQLFLEFSGSLEPSAIAATEIDRQFGQLLRYLPPNSWSPLTKSSHQELQALSAWPGHIDLNALGLSTKVPVAWRLQWQEPCGGARRLIMRCATTLELASRTEVSRAMVAIHAPSSSGDGIRLFPSTIDLPGGSTESLEARLERAVDALDLVSLEDDSGDTRGLGRQRHMYGETPVIIELWSAGDYVGRTWIILAEDVVSRFGSIDLSAVEALIRPDLAAGRRALAQQWKDAIIVNEQ